MWYIACFAGGFVVATAFWLLFYNHNKAKWAVAAREADEEARRLVARIAALERKLHGD